MRGRNEASERLVLGGIRSARIKRDGAALRDHRICGGGQERLVDIAAVGGASGSPRPRERRTAGHAVVLLGCVVEVRRAQHVPQLVHERTAVAWIEHLRDAVRPERIAPGNRRLVEIDLVLVLLLGIVRPQKKLHLVGRKLLAVDIARHACLALRRTVEIGHALGCGKGRRTQLRGARAAFVAVEADAVRKRVVATVPPERMRRGVRAGVGTQHWPGDVLRVLLEVVGDGAAAHAGEVFNRLCDVYLGAVGECDEDHVHNELACEHRRCALGRERRRSDL